MVNIATRNGNFYPFFSVNGILVKYALVILTSLSQIMVDKMEEPLFASTEVGKRSNRNRCSKVLFTDDPRSSAPQSPVGMGARLGSGIWNQVGRLNCTPG